jgi:hypothetical protein
MKATVQLKVMNSLDLIGATSCSALSAVANKYGTLKHLILVAAKKFILVIVLLVCPFQLVKYPPIYCAQAGPRDAESSIICLNPFQIKLS